MGKKEGNQMFLEWNWRRGNDGALCNSMKLGRAMASQLYAPTSPAEMRNQTDQERLVTAKYHDLNPMSFKCRYDETIEKQLVCRKGKWTELEKNACHKRAKACLLKEAEPLKPLNNAVQGRVPSGKYVWFNRNGEKLRLHCRNSWWKLGYCPETPRNKKVLFRPNKLNPKQQKQCQKMWGENSRENACFCHKIKTGCRPLRCDGKKWQHISNKKLRI